MSLDSMMQRGPYGVTEQNPITDEIKKTRDEIDHQNPVWLNDPRLARITRLRLVGDPGLPFLDVSYCYGELKDGTPVRVELPWFQFNRRKLARDLVEMCKQEGVYAKGLGLLDPANISILV